MRASLTLLSLTAAITFVAAQPPTPPNGQWVLAFEDDFPGNTLNATNWNVAVNRTQDAGHSVFIPENVNVSGGNLIITAQMQQYQVGNNTVNFTSESSANHEPNATSGSSRKLHADSNVAAPLEFELRQVHGAGRQTVIESLGGCAWIDTRNHVFQRNARWEARIKLPPTAATCSWPAFWLLPNPDAMCWPIGGEIDIMEYVAGFQYQHNNHSLPSAIDFGEHFGYACYKDASGNGIGGTYPNTTDKSAPVIDYSADFHIFGAILNDTAVTFYVDDTVVWTLSPPPQTDPSYHWGSTPYVPFTDTYAIINYSVAPYGCTQPPPADAWTEPHQLFVDYVRMYTWKPDASAGEL